MYYGGILVLIRTVPGRSRSVFSFQKLSVIRWSRWVEHAARLEIYCQEAGDVSLLDVRLYYYYYDLAPRG
jgi:hypothetical protein